MVKTCFPCPMTPSAASLSEHAAHGGRPSGRIRVPCTPRDVALHRWKHQRRYREYDRSRGFRTAPSSHTRNGPHALRAQGPHTARSHVLCERARSGVSPVGIAVPRGLTPTTTTTRARRSTSSGCACHATDPCTQPSAGRRRGSSTSPKRIVRGRACWSPPSIRAYGAPSPSRHHRPRLGRDPRHRRRRRARGTPPGPRPTPWASRSPPGLPAEDGRLHADPSRQWRAIGCAEGVVLALRLSLWFASSPASGSAWPSLVVRSRRRTRSEAPLAPLGARAVAGGPARPREGLRLGRRALDGLTVASTRREGAMSVFFFFFFFFFPIFR